MSNAKRSDEELTEAKRRIEEVVKESVDSARKVYDNSIHFRGRQLDENFKRMQEELTNYAMEFASKADADIEEIVNQLRDSLTQINESGMLGRVTPENTARMERLFYREEEDGSVSLSDSALRMVEDRWPLTPQLSFYFEFHLRNPEVPLAMIVEMGIENSLDENRSPHLTRDEVTELLWYYRTGGYKACYFIASSYCERVFADIQESSRVNGFKGNLKNLHEPFKDGWGGPLLNGFTEAVEKHWADADRTAGVPNPTRHSVAHGIHADRPVSKADALQMMLILQELPFWMDYIREIESMGN